MLSFYQMIGLPQHYVHHRCKCVYRRTTGNTIPYLLAGVAPQAATRLTSQSYKIYRQSYVLLPLPRSREFLIQCVYPIRD